MHILHIYVYKHIYTQIVVIWAYISMVPKRKKQGRKQTQRTALEWRNVFFFFTKDVYHSPVKTGVEMQRFGA